MYHERINMPLYGEVHMRPGAAQPMLTDLGLS